MNYYSKPLRVFRLYILQNVDQLHRSFKITPTSGVPQGSILGPLLFLLFINDLLVRLTSCLGFADDLKIYRKIELVGDCMFLQYDVNVIQNWCSYNQLPINISKCVVMSTTNKRDKLEFEYKLSNTVLKRVANHRDL